MKQQGEAEARPVLHRMLHGPVHHNREMQPAARKPQPKGSLGKKERTAAQGASRVLLSTLAITHMMAMSLSSLYGPMRATRCKEDSPVEGGVLTWTEDPRPTLERIKDQAKTDEAAAGERPSLLEILGYLARQAAAGRAANEETSKETKKRATYSPEERPRTKRRMDRSEIPRSEEQQALRKGRQRPTKQQDVRRQQAASPRRTKCIVARKVMGLDGCEIWVKVRRLQQGMQIDNGQWPNGTQSAPVSPERSWGPPIRRDPLGTPLPSQSIKTGYSQEPPEAPQYYEEPRDAPQYNTATMAWARVPEDNNEAVLEYRPMGLYRYTGRQEEDQAEDTRRPQLSVCPHSESALPQPGKWGSA